MNLREMTAKAGSMENGLLPYAQKAQARKDQFSHVGDIENIVVLKSGLEFLLYSDSDFVGYFYIDKNKDRFVLRLAFVDKGFRRQNVLEKFIWFLVKHEAVEELEISDVHSQDTIDAFKKLSYRMDLFWEKDGKQEKYDLLNLSKHYGAKQTGWVLIVKNDGAKKAFEDWPRYNNVPDPRCLYDWLLEKVD